MVQTHLSTKASSNMAAKYFLALLVACAAVQVIYGFPSIDFGDLMNKMKEKAEEVVKKVKEDFGSMEDKMKDIWNNMKGKLENVWDEISKKIQDIISGIKGKLGEMELNATTDAAKKCIADAKDQLTQAEAEIEPKVQACVEQVQKDMQPMVSDIQNEINNLAPKMSDEVKTCMQLSNWQQCMEGASELAPELKTAMQNMFGDAGKIAQMMPTEAQKAKKCVAPIISDIIQKGQTIVSGAASCIKQAIVA